MNNEFLLDAAAMLESLLGDSETDRCQICGVEVEHHAHKPKCKGMMLVTELKNLAPVLEVVREAREHGWYEENPGWEPVDNYLTEARSIECSHDHVRTEVRTGYEFRDLGSHREKQYTVTICDDCGELVGGADQPNDAPT